MIATVDELDRIAADDDADVPAMKGWRRELFGDKAHCPQARQAGAGGRQRPRRDGGQGLMNFASDNTAGVAPEIMAALAQANDGFTLGYGNDAWTKRAEQRIAEVFKRDVAVSLVTTGTACNALAIAHVTPSWGAVLCHADAHINTDECGAPEFFGDGVKLIGLPGDDGKISAEVLKAALEKPQWGAPHHVLPSVLSLSQATEAGTIYQPSEIRALADIAHKHGLAVHMDGARLGNALARMNAPPDEATWKAGVDVLSFGATKGGAMGAEAIIFFDPKRSAGFDRRRKRGGHLLSSTALSQRR